MGNKKFNIDNEISQAIKRNNLVLFIGSGINKNLKNQEGNSIGDWKTLANNMINHLGEEYNYLLPALEKHQAIDVLQLLEQNPAFTKSKIASFCSNYMKIKNEDNDLSLHKKLHELCPQIITTNYDNALEKADEQDVKRIINQKNTAELGGIMREDEPFLFKLHGCYSNQATMVIFPSDYNALYHNEEKEAVLTLEALRHIIYRRVILFVGYSMGDKEIKELMLRIKKLQGDYAPKHYVVSTTDLDSSLSDFLQILKIKDYETELPLLLDELLDIKNEEKEDKSGLATQNAEREAQLEEELKSTTNEHIIKDLKLEKAANEILEIGNSFHNKKNYYKAIEKFILALDFKPDFDIAYNNWGNALNELAKIEKVNKKKKEIYLNAIVKFEKAIGINNKNEYAYSNWGIALNELAKIEVVNEIKKELNLNAIEKYDKAIEINNKYENAYNNWGHALNELAKIELENEIKKELNLNAVDKFEKVIKINNKNENAYINWGNALNELAIIENKKFLKIELYNEAIKKYKSVLEINDKNNLAHYNISIPLSTLAQLTTNEIDKANLFKKALYHSEKAVALGEEPFNLCCVHALMGNKNEAIKYLEQSLFDGRTPLAHIEKDEDLISIRSMPEYEKLISLHKRP